MNAYLYIIHSQLFSLVSPPCFNVYSHKQKWVQLEYSLKSMISYEVDIINAIYARASMIYYNTVLILLQDWDFICMRVTVSCDLLIEIFKPNWKALVTNVFPPLFSSFLFSPPPPTRKSYKRIISDGSQNRYRTFTDITVLESLDFWNNICLSSVWWSTAQARDWFE